VTIFPQTKPIHWMDQHLKLTLMVIFLIHWVKYKSEMLNCSAISNFWRTKLVVDISCAGSANHGLGIQPTLNVLSELACRFEMWDDGLGTTDTLFGKLT
jgi:hypothetical protein